MDRDEVMLALCVDERLAVSEGVGDPVALRETEWLAVPDALGEAVNEGVIVVLPLSVLLGEPVALGL